MREESKWHGCMENIAVFGIAMLVFIVTFPIVAYVHENAYQWEAFAVFVSLVLGILPALWYWRVRRHGWAASVVAGLFLTFSFSASLFHGWEIQAAALVTVAVILLVVVMFVWMSRITRHFESAMHATGEELNGDPLFRRDALFRDDGQRITVYPRRRRLIISCILEAAILAGIACVFAFVRTDDPRLWIGLGLFACILIPVFLTTLYRTLIRKPTLVVGPDGILDDGSLLGSGVGLIRWDEILAVYPTTISSSGIKRRYLVIMVTDFRAIRRRLPLLKRLAFFSNIYASFSRLLIMQTMLETPVDDLAQQIDQYVEGHAPPGWREGANVGSESGVDNESGEG